MAMTLDLDELTAGWECPPGELRARIIVGRDGQEVLQMRVDLGVLQMAYDGRPDGQRHRGMPSARAFIEHELRVGNNNVSAEDWQELERELMQTNYRRMAFAAVAEGALEAGDETAACRFIRRALADIDECEQAANLLRRRSHEADDQAALRPTLVFDRARLQAQLKIIEGRFEEAIELAEDGADALANLLAELGCDDEQRDNDPGLCYLRGMGVHLRREYGIAQTLRERLAEAIENEDFEQAARLRDELAQRGGPDPPTAA